MQIELLTDSKYSTSALVELMTNCDLAAWAVAWATENEVLEAAYEHRGKFRHLVVGTHGYVTTPTVIERFQDEAMFRVTLTNGPLFHPKVYLFRAGDEWSAVVGSHNLTGAAFTQNREVSTLIRAKAGDRLLKELFAYVAQAWEGGAEVEPTWLESYKANHKRAKAAHRDLDRWVDVKAPKVEDGVPGPFEMGWAEFVAQVKVEKASADHTLEGRLRVLEELGFLFSKKSSFAELDVDDRKRIAGTMGSAEAKTRDDLVWAWFGAMGASGSFSTTVINNPDGLSRALDFIPQTGPVNAEDYELFCEEFKGALSPDLYASGGIATGTRLLAMKRPDQFVCINKPNRRGIALHFNVPFNTSLDTYWERIILRIRGTDWWLAPEPTDPLEKRIWAGRAALLDAIYYDPKTRL